MSLGKWISENIVDLGGGDENKEQPVSQPTGTPQPKKVAVAAEPVITYGQQTAQPQQQTYIAQPVTAVNVDAQKFKEHFDKFFADADLPGPDYYEFMGAVNDNLELGLDQAKAVAGAFKTLSRIGLTKQILVTSAQKYLQLLEQDKSDFVNQLANMKAKEIDGRQNQITNLGNDNVAKQEQIAKLNQEINANLGTIQTLSIELVQQQQKAAGIEANYNSVFNAVQQKLTQDIDVINTLINNN